MLENKKKWLLKGGGLLLGNCYEPLEMSISDMEGDHPGCDMLYSYSRFAISTPCLYVSPDISTLRIFVPLNRHVCTCIGISMNRGVITYYKTQCILVYF